MRSCLKENNIYVLKWPAQSADLNPIENLWNNVEQHVVRAMPRNLVNIWTEIEKAWYAISVERSMGLVESMPRRLDTQLNVNKLFLFYAKILSSVF